MLDFSWSREAIAGFVICQWIAAWRLGSWRGWLRKITYGLLKYTVYVCLWDQQGANHVQSVDISPDESLTCRYNQHSVLYINSPVTALKLSAPKLGLRLVSVYTKCLCQRKKPIYKQCCHAMWAWRSSAILGNCPPQHMDSVLPSG